MAVSAPSVSGFVNCFYHHLSIILIGAGVYFASSSALRGDPGLLAEVASRLLEAHFPASLHQDILDAVGLDSAFTETVVCGFDVRLCNQPIGLEAAHIQWHQAGGPDVEHNGLALCSLHHKAFDMGAFTILPDQVLLVSERTYGRSGFDEWLLRFHGHPIRKPLRESYLPGSDFLVWHEKEVFKRPPRELECAR